jgi:hypothetical protein
MVYVLVNTDSHSDRVVECENFFLGLK